MNASSLCKTAGEVPWLLAFILAPLLYSSHVYAGALLPKLLALQILLLPLWALWFYRFAIRCEQRPSPAVSAILLGYALWHILSIFGATNVIEGTLQLAHYISFIFIPFLVAGTLFPSQISRILPAVAWVGLPVSVIGIAQYHGWGFYDIPSNANPSATFFHRNAAAEYLIVALPMAWVGLRLARTRFGAVMHGLLLAFLGTYLLYTRTRGAWVGLTAACAITALAAHFSGALSPKRDRFRAAVAVAALCLAIAAGSLPGHIVKPGAQKFDEKKSDVLAAIASIPAAHGDRGRRDLWRHTLAMIADHPTAGVGLGNWQYVYPAYAGGEQIDVKASPIRPHNDILWIAAELGLPGLLLFLSLIGITGRSAWRLLKTTDARTRVLILGLIALITAHLVEGLFNFPRERIAPALFFWFAIGAIDRLNIAQNPPPGALPRFRLARGVVMILAGLVFFGALIITYRFYRYDQHHLLVFTAERQEDWPTVVREAEQARHFGALRANTFIALGRARYHLGDPSGAIKAYELGLHLHPYSLNAYNNLGIAYRRLGELKKAETALQKAVALFPNFEEAYYNLGNVYRDMNQWDRAATAYRMAIAQGLSAAEVYFNLGRSYHAQGELLKAQQQYLLALKQQPDFEPARRALALLGASPSTRHTDTH